ncbi:hypothetical protein D3C85_452540 [compost metagenome]
MKHHSNDGPSRQLGDVTNAVSGNDTLWQLLRVNRLIDEFEYPVRRLRAAGRRRPRRKTNEHLPVVTIGVAGSCKAHLSKLHFYGELILYAEWSNSCRKFHSKALHVFAEQRREGILWEGDAVDMSNPFDLVDYTAYGKYRTKCHYDTSSTGLSMNAMTVVSPSGYTSISPSSSPCSSDGSDSSSSTRVPVTVKAPCASSLVTLPITRT